MIFFPHAKINIGLQVLRKREDGFHDLSLSFVPLWDLHDILEIIPAEKDSFKVINCSDMPALGSGHTDNLVVKARDLLRRYADIPPCAIYLYKHIPIGAGLGGGSSDCAYTLHGLNKVFSLGFSIDELQNHVRLLGSDCAFFLENGKRIANGRGDYFTAFERCTPANIYDVVVIKPSFSISTAEAYESVIPDANRPSLTEFLRLPLEQWRNNIENDFEKFLREKYPQIEEIKNELYEKGALYASLSGSGSAIYGIFEHGCSPRFNAAITADATSAIPALAGCRIFYCFLEI
ncbi:MAG: 4-(cytidine 5'-diphospho)-2-C-methyl-D-erythritol kinase [Bacteroidales bacterium]|jgi:4-diphosphocytidyl-2-C-methyl-D-erythritol kinase|nr:4-(cytidine 5'-diphospho)-2-C-methyl-D-erythritol kinase [Bacteroidales bacterium]